MQEISKYKTTFFLRYFGEFVFYSLLVVYLKDKGFSGTQVGAVLSFSPIILAFSLPLWLIFDHGKSRKMLILIAVMAIIALELVLTFVPKFALLAVFMVIYSIARSPLSSSMESMAYVYCVENKREYSSIRIWGSAGYIAAVLAGSFLYDYVNFIWLVVISATALIALVAALMSTKPLGIDAHKESSDHDFRLLVRNKEFIIFLMIQTVCITIMNVNNSYDILYQHSRGMDTSLFGLTTFIRVTVEIGMLILLRKHRPRFRYLFLAVPFLMLAQSILYFFAAPVWTIFAVTPLTGTASGIIIYLGNKYISIIVRPRNITVATYAMIIANNLSLALCLFLGGMVIDFLNINYIYLFSGIAFIIISLMIVGFVGKDPQPKAEKPLLLEPKI